MSWLVWKMDGDTESKALNDGIIRQARMDRMVPEHPVLYLYEVHGGCLMYYDTEAERVWECILAASPTGSVVGA